MLKIRRFEHNGLVTLALSGRIEQEHVTELQNLIAAETGFQDLELDLEEVKLVDRDAVRFLAACEARGLKLKACPSYIRQWIETGAIQPDEPQC